MNERVKQLGQALTARLRGLNATERLRWGALVALAATVLIVGLSWLTRTNWQPLYTNLVPKAAGQITNQLTQMKIPYQLADQGRTVLVPQQDVNQVRVSLADHNIPSTGTVGMPQPMSFSLGETSQEIRIQQLINLEAGLEQTINSIQGVKSSRVTINQPPTALFGEGTSPATAAVFVSLQPGTALSSHSVQGIMNLVAHSVSGLSIKHVAVVDQAGTLLSRAALSASSANSPGAVANSQLAAQNAVDQQVASNVSSMLNQVLGPGHAVVRVNTNLNFQSGTVTKTRYGPSVLSSQQVTTAASKGAGVALKQAGAAGNVPNYAALGGGGPTSSNTKTTISRYVVNKQQSQQVVPAGSIQRMTIAVAVDQRLTAAQTANLSSLVSQAAGINPARGDKVSIVGQPFNHQLVQQALTQMASAQKAQRLRQEIEAGLGLLAALGLAWGIRRSLKQAALRRAMAEPALALDSGTGLTVGDFIQRLEEEAPPEALPAEVPRKHLQALLKREPEAVATLLRSWMEED